MAGAVLTAGCGAPAREAGATARAAASGAAATPHSSVTGTPEPDARAWARPPVPPIPVASPGVLTVAPGAGRLPQTTAQPSTSSAAFHDAMADLWLAVTTGRPADALPAFFPLAAYQQLKAIYDPAGDWHGRLWADFVLDVAVAHSLLGDDGLGGAHLVQVVVATGYATWISPGVCANSIGYWHVPGARVVYRQHGQLRSFGIASLISWRGDWYVVHFGAVVRDPVAGFVDQPAIGPGVPGPPGGC